MKFCRMIATGLAALTASLTSSGFINACEQCRSRAACQACAAGDDRGLLDSLSEAAQRLQPRLPRWTPPRLPSLDVALRQALGGRLGSLGCASCGCELNSPSCGCELREPTCGCELREPTCGCELREPTCGCELREPTCGCESAAVSGHPMQPMYGTGPAPHQHLDDVAPIPVPVPRQPVPQAPLPYVVPQPVPQPAPPPDSEVDPFRDDSASRLRRIPTRTIQYRQTTPTNPAMFDPQANRGGAQQRLSDTPDFGSQRIALAENSSSRSRSSAQSSLPSLDSKTKLEPKQPEVVTASATEPRRLTQSAAPLASQSGSVPEFPNPLRSR